MKQFSHLLLSVFTFIFLFTNQLSAQTNRCATVEQINAENRINPLYKEQLRVAKEQAKVWEDAHTGEGSRVVIRIPVVFHVMHNGEAIGTKPNVSDAQLISQIDQLNKDFRKTNSDTNLTPSIWKPLAADCEIEFCLASLDPTGSPSSGVTRHDMGTGTWSDTRKPATTWDRSKYLNIWVAVIGGGTLGYATPPGGSATSDGVVIGPDYIGVGGTSVSPYNKGRTGTHEVGHWLGLEHIWGDDGTACTGSDGVTDTPNQAGQNFGCPTFPKTDACSGSSPGVMFMNYMDYTNDGCMYMFTAGQKAKMVSVLNTTRASIKTSNGCGAIATIAVSGTVIDATTSAPIASAKVLFKGASDIEVTTNGSGAFTANIVAGSYDVYAGKWGYMINQFITGASYTAATSGITIPIQNGRYYDDYTLNYNWTTASTATAGAWLRNIPIGATNGGANTQTDADVTSDYTDKCFITGNGTVGGAAGAADVDGGTVTLTSPSFDLSSAANPYIKCFVWFYNGGGTGTINDNAKIKLSNGITTVEAKNIVFTGVENNWAYTIIHLSDFLTLTSEMNFILEASDIGTGHLVEAGIDQFEIIDSFGVSINDPIDNSILVYPNPTKDIVNIQINSNNSSSQNIQIISALGEIVYSNEFVNIQNTNSISINTESWQSGVYFIKYSNALKASKTIRFVKY